MTFDQREGKGTKTKKEHRWIKKGVVLAIFAILVGTFSACQASKNQGEVQKTTIAEEVSISEALEVSMPSDTENESEVGVTSKEQNTEERQTEEQGTEEQKTEGQEESTEAGIEVETNEETNAESVKYKTVRTIMHIYQDGHDSGWYSYEYDEHGYMIKRTLYLANGNIHFWDEYENDSYGHRLKNTSYNANGSIARIDLYEYDARGNRTKYSEGDATGKQIHWWEYEYDDMDRQIKGKGVNADGTVFDTWVSQYDDQGSKVAETYYNPDGSTRYYEKYEQLYAQQT